MKKENMVPVLPGDRLHITIDLNKVESYEYEEYALNEDGSFKYDFKGSKMSRSKEKGVVLVFNEPNKIGNEPDFYITVLRENFRSYSSYHGTNNVIYEGYSITCKMMDNTTVQYCFIAKGIY